jgi:ligand-binding sensor domain-containing protein
MGKYLIIISLFLNISLWSQRPPFKEFNVDNGLPSNMVRCVFKDSKGLIWEASSSIICYVEKAVKFPLAPPAPV